MQGIITVSSRRAAREGGPFRKTEGIISGLVWESFFDLSVEQMVDRADAMGIESVVIDKNTNIRDFKNELRWNEAAYK